MSSDRAPLVPSDCDLRGLAWMPLDAVRLLDSDLFAVSTGDEFKAAVALWCKAWQQIPAGSLPNDDRVLAHLSGAGSRWKRLKPMALRGFVLCSDGRLYHPVIAEKALEAWEYRKAQRARAAKRWPSSGNAAASPAAHAAASPAAMQGTGQDRKGQENSSPPTPRAAAAAVEKKLVYPSKLADGQRADVARAVADLDERGAQLVVDELEGAMRYGRKPVGEPIALLRSLVDQYRSGRFVSSHAARVQIEREGHQAKAEVAAARARDEATNNRFQRRVA